MSYEKLKRKAVLFVRVVLIIVVVASVLFAFISTHQLNKSIDLGNRKIVLNYASQIAARLHDRFRQVDLSLAELRKDIEEEESITAENLQEKMDSYSEIWSLDACGFLYDDGSTVLADDTPVVFESEISLRDVLSYSEQLNITKQLIGNDEMLVLSKPCRNQIGQRKISGIFAAIKIERLGEFMNDYEYGADSFLALTQINGNNIWKQGEDSLSGTGNCFSDLEKLSVNQKDSVLQMKTRMTVAMDGTISYEKKGQEYYMAYVPLKINYWYLLVSAQSNSIDLTELARQHFIISSLLIGVILVMGLFGIIYLIQRNRSISRHNKQLQEATALANQANEAKRDFLAKVSHEIRTPLNGVIGMLSLAEKDYDDKNKCIEDLKKAYASAEYLLGLLSDVLNMSQIESGKQKLAEETVDMKKLKKEVHAIIEVNAAKRGVSVQFDDSLLVHYYFKGDYLRLKQILVNLISNAVKYSDEGKHVWVEFSEANINGKDQVVFYVKDEGEGISEDKLETIFKPFEQVNSHKRGGVGLGLTIVKSFVELMGGQITVESKLGQGSTFVVMLPLMPTEQPIVNPEKVYADDLNGISILLAEDNNINAEIAIELLKSKGAKIELALDGEQAVEKFRQSAPGTYQVILMDIQMPNKNGIEATKEIRALNHPQAKLIPILAITANAFKEGQEEMEQAGMNDYLYKPIDIELVCSCILKWVPGGKI